MRDEFKEIDDGQVSQTKALSKPSLNHSWKMNSKMNVIENHVTGLRSRFQTWTREEKSASTELDGLTACAEQDRAMMTNYPERFR